MRNSPWGLHEHMQLWGKASTRHGVVLVLVLGQLHWWPRLGGQGQRYSRLIGDLEQGLTNQCRCPRKYYLLFNSAQTWWDSILACLQILYSQEIESRPNTWTELKTETQEFTINQNSIHLASSYPRPKLKQLGIVSIVIQLSQLHTGLSLG